MPDTQKAPSVAVMAELVDCSVICQFLGLEHKFYGLGVTEGICFYRRGREQG